MNLFYTCGGIGDFLQCTPFMIANKDELFFIHTHFEHAKQYFESFGLQNIVYMHFKNNFERTNQIKKFCFSIKDIPRSFYFQVQNNIKIDDIVNSYFKEKKPIIGIHPFGSDFSNDFYKQIKKPVKYIKRQTVEEITKKNQQFNFLIFGTKKEIHEYGIEETQNLKFICFDSIIESLLAVKTCSLFIGVDSCFKNMACMNKIKTFCLCGDFDDVYRDILFFNQYEKDGFLQTHKIKNIEDEENLKIKSINKFLFNNL